MSSQFNINYSSLVRNFNAYMLKVDSFVKEKTHPYDAYFNEGINSFFRVIFYVIQEFLCDDNLEELFIKLPVPINELGAKSKEKVSSRTCLQEVVYFALSIATIDKQRSMITPPS